jgi:fused signal recognition particle receptor
MADVGVETSDYLVDELRERLKEKKIKEANLAREEFRAILTESVGVSGELELKNGLNILLIIGVNGVGKTTSIGKITHCLSEQGKKVMLAAADTFRAAAAEQLTIWADRNNVPIIKQNEGADPAAVVFDAIAAAKKANSDVLIVDTAGRLHNKKNLIDELAKINRVIDREAPDSTRETLLVLDASTGQNALIQANEFGKAANITGLVLTKLDGTAKGGIILAIKRELGIPVKFIGVGEGIDDLRPFNPSEFINAFFEDEKE